MPSVIAQRLGWVYVLVSPEPSAAISWRVGDFWSGFKARSRLNLMAVASHGSPLWNLTPGRILNTQVVGEVLSQVVASIGWSLLWPSRWTSESNMCIKIVLFWISVCIGGSSDTA